MGLTSVGVDYPNVSSNNTYIYMNQHFVPQVYLKNFSFIKKDKYYIEVFNKMDNSEFCTNIRNICGEQELYTLPNDSKISNDPLIIENIYSRFLEPTYSRAYKLLTDDTKTTLNLQERFDIIAGILQFYFRNPLVIKRNIHTHIEPLRRLYLEAKKNNQPDFKFSEKTYSTTKDIELIIEEFKEYGDLMFKENNVSTLPSFVEKHANTSITVWKSNGKENFITSDIPLLMQENIEENDFDPFLISKQFTLPLDNQYVVILCYDKFQSPFTIKRETVSNGRVNPINNLIFESSSSFILGAKRDILAFLEAKKHLDKIMTSENLFSMMSQLYHKFPTTTENVEMKKFFKKYIDIYLEKKNFNSNEHTLIMNGIKELNKDFHRKKI